MRLHMDRTPFASKPTGAQIGGIKRRMKDAIVDVSIEEIAEAIKNGQTLQPAVTPFSEVSRAAGKKGTVDSDFEGQTIFMIDIDNDQDDRIETIEEADNLLTILGVRAAIIYETYGSTETRPKFRILIVCDEEITDRAERDTIQEGLLASFPQADKSCINADRIFFGTNKGLAIYRPEEINKKEWLLGFAGAFLECNSQEYDSQEYNSASLRAETTEPPGEIITVGNREQAMFDEATKLITRLGDTPKAREQFDKFLGKLEVVPGEGDPPQARANYIYDRCREHFHNVTEKDPEYKPAEEFEDDFEEELSKAGDKRSPYTKYQYLAAVYRAEHKYVIGVQNLVRGGYGNDLLYEYKNGVWHARSESDVRSQLAKRVLRTGATPDPTQIDKAYKVIMNSGKRVDVKHFNSNEDLVCFKNAVYRLSDGAVLDHSPDYYFTIQLNAEIPLLDPLAEEKQIEVGPTPYCDLCLRNFGDEEVQNLLLQVFGAAISNVFIPRFKKAVLMYGPGNSGKTQFKGLAERILGRDNFNNVDLSDLESNRFLSAAFEYVRLGGSNDLSNVRVKEQKIFKMLTGGDNIQAEHKGEDSFTFQYKGLLWFLANQLPLFGGDKGDHVYDRWIVIECNNPVPKEKQIKDLQDRMFKERNSFCIRALRAFQKAVVNNYTFDIPEASRMANEQYKVENSSVRMFIDECCGKLNPDTAIKDQTTGKFWRVFKEWCIDGNYYLPPKTELRKELMQVAGINADQLITHTSIGNFYPFVVREDVLNEQYPYGVQ